MVSKFCFTNCEEHADCTYKAAFADRDDPGYDMTRDMKPVMPRLAHQALVDFGDVFCVGVEHLAGKLSVDVK